MKRLGYSKVQILETISKNEKVIENLKFHIRYAESISGKDVLKDPFLIHVLLSSTNEEHPINMEFNKLEKLQLPYLKKRLMIAQKINKILLREYQNETK